MKWKLTYNFDLLVFSFCLLFILYRTFQIASMCVEDLSLNHRIQNLQKSPSLILLAYHDHETYPYECLLFSSYPSVAKAPEETTAEEPFRVSHPPNAQLTGCLRVPVPLPKRRRQCVCVERWLRKTAARTQCWPVRGDAAKAKLHHTHWPGLACPTTAEKRARTDCPYLRLWRYSGKSWYKLNRK